MALTVTNVFGGTDPGRTPAHPIQALRCAPDTSYAAGGYAIPAAALPAGSIFIGVAQACPETVANRLWHWNNTTQKLFCTVSSTGAELADAQNPSADRITLVGIFA